MGRPSAYLIGTFGDWRDSFIDALPEWDFEDPRTHDQSSIVRLNMGDMSAARNSDVGLVYIPKGKDRAGVTSYCEMGVVVASGKSLVVVDDGDPIDQFSRSIASAHFIDKETAINFLKKGCSKYTHEFLPRRNVTGTKETYQRVLFTGDLKGLDSVISSLKGEKKDCRVDFDPQDLSDFTKNDLVVVNFNRGQPHNKNGLFAMGLAFATHIPVIELEGNPIPYPPILGLARRVFSREDRFEHAFEYLNSLGSQHISDEALVYYALMQKFNIDGQ